MKLAVNYSPTVASLAQNGQVNVDLFKCPPWPHMVEEAQQVRPVYVHFPLRVGGGRGTAIDNSSGQPADWAMVDFWLERTETPFVNLHLAPLIVDYPGFETLSLDEDIQNLVTGRTIRDVESVTARFGPERVILENYTGCDPDKVFAGAKAEIVSNVVAACGCGLLLDVSHARLAAARLGMEPRRYIESLPTESIRELHLTGIQVVDAAWIRRLRKHEAPAELIQRFSGKEMDHVPFTEKDWIFVSWVAEQIRGGQWAEPEIVAEECGGVGAFWEAVTDEAALAQELPRLQAMFKPK